MGENGTDGGGEGAFDANAFEKKMADAKKGGHGGGHAEPVELTVDTLTAAVDTYEVQPGEETPITRLDCISGQWRRMATQAIKGLDSEAYAEYRKIKYEAGGSPDLPTRMKAYGFVVNRFLDLTFVPVDPDEVQVQHHMAAEWRRKAVEVMRIMKPELGEEYDKLRKQDGGSMEARKMAYVFAVNNFLKLSYKIAGF